MKHWWLLLILIGTNICAEEHKMSQQILRDRNGVRIGIIESIGHEMIGRDKNGVRVGVYNPNLDVTYDKNGVRVGSGNLLSSLIH